MKTTDRKFKKPPHSPPEAFTLHELLIVIGICILAGTLVWSSLARTGPDVQNTLCLSAKRQLGLSAMMYADDNAGKFAPNLYGTQAQGGSPYGTGYVEGWLDWTTAPDNTNVLFLSSVRYARIGPYVQGATNIFRCPADKYVSSLQKSRGWFQRARSISLNAGIGEGNAESGPWDSLYRHIRKIYEFRYPVPAETLTFLDEHPDSINDPAFHPPHVNSWVDVPATYHDGAAGVTFADGHVEMHRWTGSLLSSALVRYAFAPVPTVAGDSDLHWISYHSPRISTNTY